MIDANEGLPVWQTGRDHFQSRAGVHRPWIAEISPMQYAGLSKRGKVEYDAKRSREWQASADCAAEYAAACFAAWETDASIYTDPRIHPDAKTAIFHERLRREKAAADARFKALQDGNAIRSADEIQIGDRVYWLLGGRYITVTKKSKASIRAVDDTGEEHKAAIRACQWLHYNELRKAADEGRTTVRLRPLKEG